MESTNLEGLDWNESLKKTVKNKWTKDSHGRGLLGIKFCELALRGKDVSHGWLKSLGGDGWSLEDSACHGLKKKCCMCRVASLFCPKKGGNQIKGLEEGLGGGCDLKVFKTL